MANNKMLIDASHPEETRVAVVRGNRIEEFDFESQAKRQLRGNIYLAKVTRVEPSLQAAFVDYGGNRHGFLAFSEIHPDYYQIPVADRQALLEEEAREAEEFGDEEPGEARPRGGRGQRRRSRGGDARGEERRRPERPAPAAAAATVPAAEPVGPWEESADGPAATMAASIAVDQISEPAPEPDDEPAPDGDEGPAEPAAGAATSRTGRRRTRRSRPAEAEAEAEADDALPPDTGDDEEPDGDDGAAIEDEQIESVGQEDALEELPQRRRLRRQYKIQEVIKRRQIMLVQVVKEERGNKGAALTTYLSLAGRYCVLMPNTARGGGISRKITNANDRKRLKAIAGDLEVPKGMGVILRTAGAARTKAEIKRDFEYLMRLWENVRTLTLSSTAPCLVYEEGSLIKRSIRDLYDKNIGEILVQGEAGYREAKDFMRMLMPSHARNVKLYSDIQSIFSRNGVESQLDKLLAPQVTLKSGGYVVINQTEALVSIDVNSGRATREHSIEDTALQTNLEAAEEIARQLRLRDLAGLIVIDFIDMEEKRNNRAVEKRLKDALKNDRARIQVGRISHFGLLEMSRQRIRASVMESTMEVCPYCQGLGHVRSHASIALHVFRAIEDHVSRHSRNDVIVRCPVAIALDLLNHKRTELIDLEQRYGVRITVTGDAALPGQNFVIEKGEAATGTPQAPRPPALAEEEEEETFEEPAEEADEEPTARESVSEEERGRRRKKRRRRRGRQGEEEETARREAAGPATAAEDGAEAAEEDEEESEAGVQATDEQPRRRRRGKRGGRRNRRLAEDGDAEFAAEDAEEDDESAITEEAAEVPIAPAAAPAAVTGAAIAETPAAEVTAPAAAREAASALADEEEDDEASAASRRRRTTRRPRGEATEKVLAEASSVESVSAPDESVPPREEQPERKRSGWWSRGGGFF
ncbi:MAG: hypothetical protein BroJett030_07300 [Alphaproteobacteria bacterium]|nr:MAG: hypothetical protein BroJett030_07300 [Alphaproteobacteria bacterium]